MNVFIHIWLYLQPVLQFYPPIIFPRNLHTYLSIKKKRKKTEKEML